ncbi:NEDD8 ultimate buster 1 [Periophthalmus magnuspinnatus]|uniref:NEDD8 ultimate buster 1 n=1 Tax=Periophthalmus magnuspinnatus TaxID=409849 RepID=UPI00145A7DAD|nr:NEDD8 ultimate buster 1 [Periophthalmus magnuspinnatus]
MAEQNIEAKLKILLKQQKIQLWNPPYTLDNRPSPEHMQELSEQYAPLLGISALEVGGALESIRAQAVNRGKGNQMFRETSVATLELLLPRDASKDPKTKTFFQTKLDVSAQELVDRIREDYGLKSIKLILNGRTLNVDQRLDEQGVRNHSKMMVLRVSDAEELQKQQNQNQSLQRTHKGFQILSEREEDLDSKPFLEIADQKGNPLNIPHQEKKALILAMGFHEKGRSLMKRKQFDIALCHLLQADQQFSKCGSALLSSVDNFAVLQLDIVWCYRALEALSCLEDAKSRLQRAESSFLQVYGEQQQRLRMIKGNTGREEVLFLRLYLLQSLLAYIEGNDAQAKQQLSKVEALYRRLSPDTEKMEQLMTLGFTEREARLGLRACEGDVQEAALHISNRRQEREEMKARERQKRRTRLEAVTVLTGFGFNRKDAARALNQTKGNVDQAYTILLNSSQITVATNNNSLEAVSPDKVEQLLYLGFERQHSETALRLTDGDVQAAAQLLLENQGELPPDLTQESSSSGPTQEEAAPSASTSTSSTSTEDDEVVSEVLEDISRHEEDYLDLTLEEESELIATLQSHLSRPTQLL